MTRRYLDVRYDVTDLDDDEIGCLAMEAVVQAEDSDGSGDPDSPGHPSVHVESEVVEVEEDDPTLSKGALYEAARSLADRGEDYGWNVYRNGVDIDAETTAQMADDPGFANWVEAFNAATNAYRNATGEDWSY